MTKIILQDCFIGDFATTQSFGVNYDSYKWILDVNGKPIKGHNGWDVGTPNGTKLINPFPKTSEVVVSHVGFDKSGYGNFLRMWDKTQGFVMLYAHCEKIVVQANQKPGYQQLVAISDNTGWSTGAHCHIGGYHVDKDGNRINRDNGFDGWVNILSKDVVTWNIKNPKEPGTTVESMITIDGGLYEKLVNGSTVRKQVAEYLEIPEPDNASIEAFTKVIAGIRSATTACQTNLNTKEGELGKALQEVANREEQVVRIKQSSEESAKLAQAQIDALKKGSEAFETLEGQYKGRIEALEKQVTEANKAKGKALNDLAECRSGIKKLTLIQKVLKYLRITY